MEFKLGTADVALGDTLDSLPGLTCTVEQVIASTGHGLWFDGVDQSSLEGALQSDPTVESWSLIVSNENRLLYDVTFTDDALDVVEIVVEERGTVLAASASEGTWHFRVRFVQHDDASQLYDRLENGRVDTTLLRLTELREAPPTTYGLTEKQYETLLTALDHGYFTIPRETSMEELADELGVSHQALSERFRRAYRALVLTELNGNGTANQTVETDKAT